MHSMTVEKQISESRVWREEDKIYVMNNGEKQSFRISEFLNRNPETDEELDIYTTLKSCLLSINDDAEDQLGSGVVWSTNESRYLKANIGDETIDIGEINDEMVQENTRFDSFEQLKNKSDNIGVINIYNDKQPKIVSIQEKEETKKTNLFDKVMLFSVSLGVISSLATFATVLFSLNNFISILPYLLIIAITTIVSNIVINYLLREDVTVTETSSIPVQTKSFESKNIVYNGNVYPDEDLKIDVVRNGETVRETNFKNYKFIVKDDEELLVKSNGDLEIDNKPVYINHPVESNTDIKLDEVEIGGDEVLIDTDSELRETDLEEYINGTGSKSNPYKVSNKYELSCITGDNYYELDDNVDMNGCSDWRFNTGFEPISEFNGVFDGNGYAVRNISGKGFIEENNGTIINTGFENVDYSGEDEIGGVADVNNGTIENVYITGFIEADDKSGDITVSNNWEVSKCVSDCSVINRDFQNNKRMNGLYIKGNDFLDSKYAESDYKILSKEAITGLNVTDKLNELDFDEKWNVRDNKIPNLQNN